MKRLTQPPSSRAKAGFTLIELLVVIGIIGLLAALLLGVISGAVESGRKTTCLNNLGQIGKAFRNYAEENDNRLPPTGTSAVNTNWSNQIALYMGMRLKQEDYITNDQISKSKSMICPTNLRRWQNEKSFNDNSTILRTYGRNNQHLPLKKTSRLRSGVESVYPQQTFPMSLFLIPAKTMLACDAEWNTGNGQWKIIFNLDTAEGQEDRDSGQNTTYAHGKEKFINGVFMDGHSVSLNRDDIPDTVDGETIVNETEYTARMFWQGIFEP